MLKITSGTFAVAVAVVLLCLPGCSGPAQTSGPYAGLSKSYEPGTPTFDAQVQPAASGDRRGLQVDVSAPELTLVFERSGSINSARIEWLVRLMRVEGRQVLEERTHRETVLRENTEAPTLFRRSSFSAFFEAPSGRYIVEIVLEDLSSGKMERKELVFDLPTRNRSLIATDLRLEMESGESIVELTVPDTSISRRAVLYLTGNVLRPALLRYRVVRLELDDAAPQPPFWQGPRIGFSGLSLAPYMASDTLAWEDRIVERGRLTRIVFLVPALRQGVYRATVDIEDLQTEGDPPVTTLSRYINVRRQTFPLLESFEDLIPPLFYLAEASEWESLEPAIGTDIAKSEFDKFWGTWMQDRVLAARVVQTYFSRVEEANLRYSGFKEGWKTDRGMVYIILGEPLFIERARDTEVWYYSYDEGRGERSFVFNRIWREDVPETIEEFLLERSFEYERFWRGEINRWRTGTMMTSG